MNAPADINITSLLEPLDQARATLNSIILGKNKQIDLAICCLLAKGHLLIEDLPGVGKTTLALAMAKVFGLEFQRIQFTSDLLPADIIGVSIFDSAQQQFNFHKGPIFSQCVLADEVNRATPKTQSALLEAMEEQQVSIEGKTFKLPEPFFTIGTQNPLDQSGTYPLPESQLDRFMMSIELGYPDQQAEHALYTGTSKRDVIKHTQAVTNIDFVQELQQAVKLIHVSTPLINYLQQLINATRDQQRFSYGLSPRAGLAIVQASKAWALLQHRNYVEPDDIKAVFASVATHRLIPLEDNSKGTAGIIEQLIHTTPIP